MEYFAISSSAIAEIGYDEETSTLGVRFRNGSEYRYLDVPRAVFESLLTATSVGWYFDRYVRNAGYSYVRIS